MRICAPSMPLFSEPSTRLSRVAPQEACLDDLDVGHAVLGEQALLLGDHQRRGIHQRDVAEDRLGGFRVPRPARHARRTGTRSSRRHQRGRAGGLQQRAPADAVLLVFVVMKCCSLCRFGSARRRPVEPIKKPQPEMRVEARPQSGGVACRPVIGPAAQHVWRRRSSSPLQAACQIAGAEITV